jgi:hypothetical protein
MLAHDGPFTLADHTHPLPENPFAVMVRTEATPGTLALPGFATRPVQTWAKLLLQKTNIQMPNKHVVTDRFA